MHGHASLNRIYRLVWSSVHQTWVVASEVSRGRGKAVSSSLVAAALSLGGGALLFLQPGFAHAAPAGGQVVSGSASITQSGIPGQSTTTIKQSSDKLSLGWQSFNVGTSETVNFLQPSASALAVNRIYDTQGSQILGRINANGQVWLINPNGVLFGKDAQINVGALVASTLDTPDATLGQSGQRFSGSSMASVANLGQINAAQGGYVALLGQSVSNQSSITAPGGTVALGAGGAVSLNFAGSKLLGLQVEQNQINALADNGGLIQADGGQVLLSAGARDSLLASAVNNTGIIQARTVQAQDGKIILLGGLAAGTTNVGGTLDASAPNTDGTGGNGGFIETSAHIVKVADDAKITTASAQGAFGTWLLDPTDFTISSGSGPQTGSGIGVTTLQNQLANSNVKITTVDTGAGNGDLTVEAAVSWSQDTTLSLSAYRHVKLNNAITASGAKGGLTVTSAVGVSGSIYLAANVTTGGNQTYNGSLVLNAASTLQSKNADISIAGGIASGTASALTLDIAALGSVDGVISGTTALTKAGAGDLELSVANTYTGGTTINGGLLNISSDSSLGLIPSVATADSITMNGGGLYFDGKFGTLNANRGIRLLSGGAC